MLGFLFPELGLRWVALDAGLVSHEIAPGVVAPNRDARTGSKIRPEFMDVFVVVPHQFVHDGVGAYKVVDQDGIVFVEVASVDHLGLGIGFLLGLHAGLDLQHLAHLDRILDLLEPLPHPGGLLIVLGDVLPDFGPEGVVHLIGRGGIAIDVDPLHAGSFDLAEGNGCPVHRIAFADVVPLGEMSAKDQVDPRDGCCDGFRLCVADVSQKDHIIALFSDLRHEFPGCLDRIPNPQTQPRPGEGPANMELDGGGAGGRVVEFPSQKPENPDLEAACRDGGPLLEGRLAGFGLRDIRQEEGIGSRLVQFFKKRKASAEIEISRAPGIAAGCAQGLHHHPGLQGKLVKFQVVQLVLFEQEISQIEIKNRLFGLKLRLAYVLGNPDQPAEIAGETPARFGLAQQGPREKNRQGRGVRPLGAAGGQEQGCREGSSQQNQGGSQGMRPGQAPPGGGTGIHNRLILRLEGRSACRTKTDPGEIGRGFQEVFEDPPPLPHRPRSGSVVAHLKPLLPPPELESGPPLGPISFTSDLQDPVRKREGGPPLKMGREG